MVYDTGTGYDWRHWAERLLQRTDLTEANEAEARAEIANRMKERSKNSGIDWRQWALVKLKYGVTGKCPNDASLRTELDEKMESATAHNWWRDWAIAQLNYVSDIDLSDSALRDEIRKKFHTINSHTAAAWRQWALAWCKTPEEAEVYTDEQLREAIMRDRKRLNDQIDSMKAMDDKPLTIHELGEAIKEIAGGPVSVFINTTPEDDAKMRIYFHKLAIERLERSIHPKQGEEVDWKDLTSEQRSSVIQTLFKKIPAEILIANAQDIASGKTKVVIEHEIIVPAE